MDFLRSVTGSNNDNRDERGYSCNDREFEHGCDEGRGSESHASSGSGIGGALHSLIGGGRGAEHHREPESSKSQNSVSGTLGSLLGGGEDSKSNEAERDESSSRIGEKINTFFGGGGESEKKEDMLDKTIDFVQEHVLKRGPQDNESAFEQAKDECISDYIRGQFKATTSKELPIADK
ncbi:hypothetical protein RUND412_005520 [Rhizina undulata]